MGSPAIDPSAIKGLRDTLADAGKGHRDYIPELVQRNEPLKVERCTGKADVYESVVRRLDRILESLNES